MLHPIGDQLKVKLDDEKYNFGPSKPGHETGIVVEAPKELFFFGYHSFAFEASFMASEKILEYYTKLVGKRIAWESLQDSGRVFKEGDSDFVLLKMSDVMAVTDNVDDEVVRGDDDRARSGSFNL
jgi:hypothetical protein